MNCEDFYNHLKGLGVKEVILDWDDTLSIATITIAGKDRGGEFKLEMNNSDFSSNDL
jgi:hypothetical protein